MGASDEVGVKAKLIPDLGFLVAQNLRLNLVRNVQPNQLTEESPGMGPNQEPVDVVMVTECGFPYVKGGVGGVVNQTLRSLPGTTFGVIHLAWNKNTTTATRYEIPANVKWVQDIYLSPEEGKADHTPHATNSRIPWQRSERIHNASMASQFFDWIDAAMKGDYAPLIDAYSLYMNPLTRKANIWQMMLSPEFMVEFESRVARLGLPLTTTFWLLENFFSISRNLCGRIYPAGTVYHSQTQLYAGLVAALGAMQHGRKMILTEHGLNVRDSIHYIRMAGQQGAPEDRMDDPLKDVWVSWFLELGRFVYSQATFATYQYQRNVDEAISLGLPPSKVEMISNGIVPEDFAGARRHRDEANAVRPLDPKSAPLWRLAYVGRMIPAKGILDLVEAAAILFTQGQIRFTLDFIGPAEGADEFLSECKVAIAAHGLEGFVRFLGTKDLTQAFGEVDIMILPSHAEALPIVLLEAMASSVPVVATDVGSITQVIHDPVTGGKDSCGFIGAAGLIVPPKDPSALAGAISRLASDPDLYESCRKNGPLRVDENHRAEDIMQQYLELYQCAAERQNVPYSGSAVARLAGSSSQNTPKAAAATAMRLNISKVRSI
ncbi:MAG: DUF3492 domain-containing protein [Proteobacteria bacterium]|nr:DUF3492 domain-containing protein [Pseudomonadota bacterium]